MIVVDAVTSRLMMHSPPTTVACMQEAPQLSCDGRMVVTSVHLPFR